MLTCKQYSTNLFDSVNISLYQMIIFESVNIPLYFLSVFSLIFLISVQNVLPIYKSNQ